MAKDYFEDIVPPDEERPAPRKRLNVQSDSSDGGASAPERSIRRIDAPERRTRPSRPPVNDMRDPANFGVQQLPPRPKRPRSSRPWLWGIAIILILALCALALFMFRKTTVTVIPRSHAIVFDQTSEITAYPEATAASGTLAYEVTSSDLQASQSVPTTGTQDVQTKAQGSIMVYNDYSSAPVKLLANTRFESPDGLIFRSPTAIVVPGKNGTTPGQVAVTVFADQPGQQYNIGPVSKFTVPGLQSTPAMYANVYAQSTASTTGGFSGPQAVVDPATLTNTISALRTHLQQEAASASSAEAGTSTIVFPAFELTYQDLPQTPGSGSNVQINEEAHVVSLSFDQNAFAQTVAQLIGDDTQGNPVSLLPGQGFTIENVSASSTPGTDPLTLLLRGNATLVWQVDTKALAQALAGHDQAAFTTITGSFAGIQEAHARIEPFWKTSFPTNPTDINVTVQSSAQ